MPIAREAREHWRTLAPADPVGVTSIDFIYLTPRGDGYIYSYNRRLSQLYVVEGLR